MTIKYVAFDLDDTLFNGTLLVEKARRASIEMMLEYGLNVDPDYAYHTLQKIVKQFGSNNQSHFDNLLVRLENDPEVEIGDINNNKLVTAGIIGYHREKVKHFKLFRDVKKAFKMLRKRGIEIAIITDGIPKKQWEKILRLKLDTMVDIILISDEESVRKPDKFLFELLLHRIKCEPEEVIYVGDRIDKDVAPAHKVGINTVLIHRGTKHDMYVSDVDFNVEVEPDFHANDLYILTDIVEELNTQ